MQLKFGGWPLYFPDPDGVIASHIKSHLSAWHEPTPTASHLKRKITDDCCHSQLPLFTPNWRPEPRLSLYQMFFPAGFTRWAKIYVFMDARSFTRARNGESQPDSGVTGGLYMPFTYSADFNYGETTKTISGTLDMRISRAVKIGDDIFPALSSSQSFYLVE